MDPKIHCHTSRAQQVGIKPTSPPTKVVALPTKPQISTRIKSKNTMFLFVFDMVSSIQIQSAEYTAMQIGN
jgi:hypothetical protein